MHGPGPGPTNGRWPNGLGQTSKWEVVFPAGRQKRNMFSNERAGTAKESKLYCNMYMEMFCSTSVWEPLVLNLKTCDVYILRKLHSNLKLLNFCISPVERLTRAPVQGLKGTYFTYPFRVTITSSIIYHHWMLISDMHWWAIPDGWRRGYQIEKKKRCILHLVKLTASCKIETLKPGHVPPKSWFLHFRKKRHIFMKKKKS